jgi:hypothetical protein
VCVCVLRGVLFIVQRGGGAGAAASKFTDKKQPGLRGTKVITIFLERHKLYEAVSYVYLARHRQILRVAVKEL